MTPEYITKLHILLDKPTIITSLYRLIGSLAEFSKLRFFLRKSGADWEQVGGGGPNAHPNLRNNQQALKLVNWY